MTQVPGQTATYEDDLPRHLGPPPVPNHTGSKLHDSTHPTYTVELDNGAFHAMWEHMEAEARHRFPTRNTYAHARAYLRAVAALRKAYWGDNPPPPPSPEPRKLIRRKT
jgi:hypothetical protein